MSEARFSYRILLVEDDPDAANLLKTELEELEFDITWVSTEKDCIETASRYLPDAILLDIALGSDNGFEIAERLQEKVGTSKIPILFLSSQDTEATVLNALERESVYDFLSKGASTQIIVARLRNALRLSQTEEESPGVSRIQCDELVLDLEEVKAWLGERELSLTISEFRLLQLLISKPGKVFSRADIILGVHGENYPATKRSIDTLVKCLRQKLSSEARLIETVRGSGYRFRKA